MLNEEKVRIMTKLASYEQNEGKKYLPVSKYYRSDYIGVALIKNFFLVTIAYVLLVAIGAAYFGEELLDNIQNMNLITIGFALIVVYVLLLVLYSMLVYVLYSVRYSDAKKSVKKYYSELGKITQIYVEEDNKNVRTSKGRRR